MKKFEIVLTLRNQEIGDISDMIQIAGSHYFVAGQLGLLKVSRTEDPDMKYYFIGKHVLSIAHIYESCYLVGFLQDGLIMWSEKFDHKLFQICHDRVGSIKRILPPFTFIIKTKNDGVKLFTIMGSKNLYLDIT